jgi:ribosomal protein L34E
MCSPLRHRTWAGLCYFICMATDNRLTNIHHGPPTVYWNKPKAKPKRGRSHHGWTCPKCFNVFFGLAIKKHKEKNCNG